MRIKLGKASGLLACCLLAAAIMPGHVTTVSANSGSMTKSVQIQAYEEAPFSIRVVDSETGRGIPAVELKTTNHISYYTDSAGYVAFNEPGLMNDTVFFHMSSHGYTMEPDFFGYRGQAVDVTPGGSVTLEMDRVNLAERLYRVTGQGIYRDSVLLGEPVPIEEPIINGKVMGQDSVQTIEYKDKLYWFWGDTDRVAYPLGNFRVTGATSKLPSQGLDLDVGVDLEYFTREDGFVKSLVPPLPDGAGIAWIFGLMTVEDETGEERLLAAYSTHNPDPTAFGILIWNDDTEEFEQLVQFPGNNDWRYGGMGGQGTYYEDGGKGYYIFTQHSYPNLRVEAKFDSIIDYTQYESFTPLAPGTTYNGADTELERDADGELVWGWKKDTQMLTQDQEKELIQLGVIKPGDEHYFQLKDADSGDDVQLAQSSVEWNEYRQSYVMIGQEKFGRTSLLGEIWFSEAPAPNGPWRVAKKIITHNEYSFYNPSQHEYFIKDDGRYLYFEATFTNTFTSAPAMPRYNYNQMMYKLDLSNPELQLEEPAAAVRLAGPSAIEAGQSFDMRYGIDHVKQSIYAEDVTFAYNAEQLEFVSAATASDQVEIAGQHHSDGRIRLLLVHLDGEANGDKLILRFTSKTTGETVTTTVSVTDAVLANGEGGELVLSGASHSIQITATANTGDLNEDGKYSVGDLAIISAAYGQTSSDANWAQVKKADLNGDGRIGIEDLAAMARKIIQ